MRPPCYAARSYCRPTRDCPAVLGAKSLALHGYVHVPRSRACYVLRLLSMVNKHVQVTLYTARSINLVET